RRSMIGFIFTSLKVVSIAVSFLTLTKRFAMVLRSDDILTRLSSLAPLTAGADAGAFGAGCLAADACAFSASSLVIRPSLPVPFMLAGSIPFSRRILAAAGDAVPAA